MRCVFRTLAHVLLLTALVRPAAAQTLTSGPTTGSTTILPAKDYASYEFRDAWDMDKRTDLGWMTWSVDQPGHQMVSHQMAGCTSGVTGCQTFDFVPTESAQPLYFLLDSWSPAAAPLGRLGVKHPIRTDIFKYLIIKMRIANAVSPQGYSSIGSPPQMVFYWSRDTIYRSNPDGSTRVNGGVIRGLTGNGTVPGILLDNDGIEANQWQLYVVDLTTLKWWNQSKNTGGIVVEPPSTAWGQPGITADSLFIQPINWPGSVTGQMQIDWVQLSETPGPSGLQSIQWTGGASTYDIVISPSANCVGGNQNAPDYTVLAENVSRTSGLSFPFGALPAGTYHVGLRAAGNDGPGVTRGAIALCSAGTYVVPSQSALTFLTPTDEGSNDDYATVFLNDPWDFNAMSDIDFLSGINNPGIDTAFPAQRPDGTNLGNIRVFRGIGTSAGDPYIYPFYHFGRGLNQRIDPKRYRIFSMDMGVDADRDLNAGSVGRVLWHVSGDLDGQGNYLENTSEDLMLRHLKASSNGGLFVLDHIHGDLLNTGSIPMESDPGASPSMSGWTTNCYPPYCSSPPQRPGIDNFRIDFEEFPANVGVYIQQARLAALERTSTSYTFTWTTSVPSIAGASAVVKLYANPANVQPSSPHGTSRNPTDPTCSPSNNALKLINGPSGTAVTLGNNQAGQFTWNPQQTAGVVPYNGTDGSGEYYICGLVLVTVNSQTNTTATTLTEFPILVDTASANLPQLFMSDSDLYLTAVFDRPSNSFIAETPDQTITITQNGSGSPAWQLDLRAADGSIPNYLKLSRTSGVGAGSFTVGFNLANMHAPPLPDCTPAGQGMYNLLMLNTGGTTSNDPQTLAVHVAIKPSANTTCGVVPTSPSQPPFGYLDVPANNSTVTGSIGVSGWALDDTGVARVEIYRSCAGTIDTSRSACVAVQQGGPADKVFVGLGNFIRGARPDVENAYPTLPQADRAGWGFLLLTVMFPDMVNNKTTGGQGAYTLFAYAIDLEGYRTLLGQTNLTLDNLHATVPFGAIDTPDQGGTIPGTGQYADPNAYPNFGWALTQAGKCIDPNDPNAYQVYIDGVRRTLVRNTNWFPGFDRADISGSFPGLCNSHNAVAYYLFNASALGLSPGLHTIGWAIVDNAGKTTGIGSRFFNLASGTGGAMPADAAHGEFFGQSPDLIRPMAMPIESGARQSRSAASAQTGPSIIHRQVSARSSDVIQFDLPDDAGGLWQAYLAQRGQLRDLPTGTTFDASAARLSWQPVPGYFGDYDFVFIRPNGAGHLEKFTVRIHVE